MAIEIVPVILLPTMDASRFERCTFALEERKATMTIYMKELEPFVIFFGRLCWHRVTPFEQCVSTLTEGCHLAVAEIKGSPALKAHVNKYQLPEKDAQSLHHYRIFLGAGGVHEAFAASASLNWVDALKGWGRVKSLFRPVAHVGDR
jgi:hypothetical protein